MVTLFLILDRHFSPKLQELDLDRFQTNVLTDHYPQQPVMAFSPHPDLGTCFLFFSPVFSITISLNGRIFFRLQIFGALTLNHKVYMS